MALTEKQKTEAMAALRTAIAEHLAEIEDECHRRGLRTITNFTLVARDPGNDAMIVVITNETPEGMRKAFRVAEEL